MTCADACEKGKMWESAERGQEHRGLWSELGIPGYSYPKVQPCLNCTVMKSREIYTKKRDKSWQEEGRCCPCKPQQQISDSDPGRGATYSERLGK